MMKYRKRPVVIEAVQYVGINADECYAFVNGYEIDGECAVFGPVVGVIPTLEGGMLVHCDDWIIRGVKGEYYPCKPDIFALTYEAVAE